MDVLSSHWHLRVWQQIPCKPFNEIHLHAVDFPCSILICNGRFCFLCFLFIQNYDWKHERDFPLRHVKYLLISKRWTWQFIDAYCYVAPLDTYNTMGKCHLTINQIPHNNLLFVERFIVFIVWIRYGLITDLFIEYLLCVWKRLGPSFLFMKWNMNRVQIKRISNTTYMCDGIEHKTSGWMARYRLMNGMMMMEYTIEKCWISFWHTHAILAKWTSQGVNCSI